MKFLVLPFTFLMFLSSPLYAEENVLLHLGLSTGFGFIAENAIHNRVDTDSKRIAYATILGSIPGLIKEVSDDEFSGEDMLADVVGALAGSLIANRLNRNLTASIQKQDGNYLFGFVYND